VLKVGGSFEGSRGNTSSGEIFACGGIESFHKEQSGSSFLLRGPETFYVIKLDRFPAGSKGCCANSIVHAHACVPTKRVPT
jgi:hypothetical protein